MEISTIAPVELDALRRRGDPVELIDVRTPAEFRQVHVAFARSIPLDRLDPIAIMGADRRANDQNIYLICRSGQRSRMAVEKFQAAGFRNVVDVEGGTLAWERAGLPVVVGEKTVSLERQVRICAGMLVFVGTALGAFVHPIFLGLPGFVGAGLVFAGVTDTCGMGMILARMPWNTVATPHEPPPPLETPR